MLARGSDSRFFVCVSCVGPGVVLGPNHTPQPRLAAAVHLFGGYLGCEVSPSHGRKFLILLHMGMTTVALSVSVHDCLDISSTSAVLVVPLASEAFWEHK